MPTTAFSISLPGGPTFLIITFCSLPPLKPAREAVASRTTLFGRPHVYHRRSRHLRPHLGPHTDWRPTPPDRSSTHGIEHLSSLCRRGRLTVAGINGKTFISYPSSESRLSTSRSPTSSGRFISFPLGAAGQFDFSSFSRCPCKLEGLAFALHTICGLCSGLRWFKPTNRQRTDHGASSVSSESRSYT